MDPEELPIESKCEDLMNIVVESRKRFGKSCLEYSKKIQQMETKLLNLELKTISDCRFKSNKAAPSVEGHASKELDDFLLEIIEKQKRVEELQKKLKTTQNVVLQLKKDDIGKKLRAPLTANAMLASAKSKNV